MSKLLYLSGADVDRVGLSIAETIDAVEFALIEHAHGRTEMPAKLGVHPAHGSLLHAMPAYIQRAPAAGMKWVGAFPANSQRGIPAVTGLIILNDPETGMPLAIMDAIWITAIRTAASAAVAARKLACADSETLGVIGPGVLARACVPALRHVLPKLRLVRAYAPNRATGKRFKNEIEREHTIAVELTDSPENAVRNCDVVITASPWPSPETQPPIVADWLSEGVFCCALNFDASFTAQASASADRFFADDVTTFDFYRSKGSFAGWPHPQELSQAIAGMVPGRTNTTERLISANLGLGIYDVVVAQRISERARQLGLGTQLSM